MNSKSTHVLHGEVWALWGVVCRKKLKMVRSWKTVRRRLRTAVNVGARYASGVLMEDLFIEGIRDGGMVMVRILVSGPVLGKSLEAG